MEVNHNGTAQKIVDTLPRRAQMLFRILCRRLGGKLYCWPSLGQLGEEMGLAPRSIERWIALLVKAGVVEVEITGRANNYWIPPRENRQVRHAKMTGQARQNGLSDPPKRRVRPAKMTGLYELEANEPIEAAAASAAAAKALEENTTINALVALGLPAKGKAMSVALEDESLMEAVLSHANWRLAKKRPPDSWAGYLEICFTDPARFGFTRDEATGKWAPPRGEGAKSPAEREEDNRAKMAKRRDEQLAEKQRCEKGMALHDARREVWHNRPEAAKEKVRAWIRANEPMFSRQGGLAADNDAFVFLSRCMAVAEEWECEGKNNRQRS
jgi:hypothetical protein